MSVVASPDAACLSRVFTQSQAPKEPAEPQPVVPPAPLPKIPAEPEPAVQPLPPKIPAEPEPLLRS